MWPVKFPYLKIIKIISTSAILHPREYGSWLMSALIQKHGLSYLRFWHESITLLQMFKKINKYCYINISSEIKPSFFWIPLLWWIPFGTGKGERLAPCIPCGLYSWTFHELENVHLRMSLAFTFRLSIIRKWIFLGKGKECIT